MYLDLISYSTIVWVSLTLINETSVLGTLMKWHHKDYIDYVFTSPVVISYLSTCSNTWVPLLWTWLQYKLDCSGHSTHRMSLLGHHIQPESIKQYSQVTLILHLHRITRHIALFDRLCFSFLSVSPFYFTSLFSFFGSVYLNTRII